MSVGSQLLFSILSKESAEEKNNLFARLLDAGVTSKMFDEGVEQDTYNFILDYRQRYGLCPSLALVEVETHIRFPKYESQMPFEFWFDEFSKYIKYGILLELIDKLENKLAEGDVENAITCIGNAYAGLTDIMNEHKSVSKLSELAPEILEKHRLLQQGILHEGIFTGFEYIDRVTCGAQPGDTWVIAGESSTGKTYILCRFALSAVNTGKRCLFISMEMPNVQIGRRSLAMSSGVSSTNLRLGQLSHFGVEQVRAFLHNWDTVRDDNLLFIEGRINYSIKDVKAKIKEYKPDAVFIDGAYMLRGVTPTKSRWEMNMEVMEGLKQLAMTENITVISTFQFDQKQKSKSVATIMGGQAIGQLASIVIGIENEEITSSLDGVTYNTLTLYKGREGETGSIRLRYNMNLTTIEQEDIISGEQTRSFNNDYYDHSDYV